MGMLREVEGVIRLAAHTAYLVLIAVDGRRAILCGLVQLHRQNLHEERSGLPKEAASRWSDRDEPF
jgi:hypothetical protein